MLFIFTVRFFLATYGGASVEVIAHNPVEALAAAAATDAGWMLSDPYVMINGIDRGLLAHCQHWNGEGLDDDRFECEDCGLVYRSDVSPEPSATNPGFRAYCQNLIDSGRAW